MTPTEFTPYRNLWAAVLTTALQDHRARIVAAHRRDRFVKIEGHREAVQDFDREVMLARAYFDSADAHRIAAGAGTEIRLERVMAYLTEGLTVAKIREAA